MVVFVCCLIGELVCLYVFIVRLLVLMFAWWGLVIPTGGCLDLRLGAVGVFVGGCGFASLLQLGAVWVLCCVVSYCFVVGLAVVGYYVNSVVICILQVCVFVVVISCSGFCMVRYGLCLLQCLCCGFL